VITCEECGTQNDARARYCESCGVSLRERCPNCRAAIRARQKFCRDCGQPLPAQNGSAAGAMPEQPSVTERAAARGERKIATVLFADIANSTELIRGLDAEEARRILEPTVALMAEAVRQFDGHIVREEGDGLVASFGARPADEDHAVKACYAGLKIQEEMGTRANDVRREFGLFIQVRVGINSGSVVVTGDDRSHRIDGIATHIGARLEAVAAPGTVVVGRDTLALAEGYIRVTPIGPVSVKGIDEPIDVWELNGVNTRIRIQALAARGLSKFVGRDSEMDLLQRAATQAQSGSGQVVALVGEAGVGKSRLFLEFTRSPAMQSWLVLQAASVSYGKATSYLPLIDLLGRYFEIHARDDERRVREKIAGKLFALGEKKLLTRLPLFTGALARGAEDPGWTNMTPAERQSELFSATKQLLIRESREQPLCVVFEDLHWVDDETQAFLDVLVESIPAARLLLLVNFRPEYESRWTTKTYYSQARIDPLTAATAETLLGALLGTHPELEPIKRELIRATDGNPLFLEESVRKVIEDGLVTGSVGQWRPLGRLPTGFVPRTIQALLAARIDRLQPRFKDILRCAAVIGNDVPQSLLQTVTGLSEHELERGIHELQASEFLYEKTLFPEVEYTFKHSMTREVAYESLVREARKDLHARAARALIGQANGQLDEHVERIAEHAEQGGLWESAVEYLERAGCKAFAVYANAEAAQFFERALTALEKLPATHANLEQAVDIRFELRNALTPLGEIERILACLDQCEPILQVLGDKSRRARHAEYRCNHHFLAGEQRRAIELAEVAVELARDCGDRVLEGELLFRLGQSRHALGEYRASAALLERSIALTGDEYAHNRFDLTVIPGVVSRTWLASALTERGEFTDAIAHAKRALEVAERAEHPLSQALGWLATGHALLRKGEVDGAIAAMERGMALSDRWSLRVWRLRLWSSLGVAYAHAGRIEEALDLTTRAFHGAQEMHLVLDQSLLLARLAQVLLMAGKVDESMVNGERALEMAIAHEGKGDEAWARFLIGCAGLAGEEGALAEVGAQLGAALELARACEARPLGAFCQTALARVHALQGDESGAQQLRAEAEACYSELGMRAFAPGPMMPGSTRPSLDGASGSFMET
jgi:class 3 adenylate cyclase/tetratricopeptide (TPR) repeat protein